MQIVKKAKIGKYEQGNVVSLCPNCHRLIHRGLLDTSHLHCRSAPRKRYQGKTEQTMPLFGECEDVYKVG